MHKFHTSSVRVAKEFEKGKECTKTGLPKDFKVKFEIVDAPLDSFHIAKETLHDVGLNKPAILIGMKNRWQCGGNKACQRC